MPTNLKAKVIQPLQMNANGVSHYMQVEAPNARYQILPVANVTGIYTQLTAKPGETVNIAHIGRSTSPNEWATLLNAAEAEFGFPVEYHNLSSRPQVFYLGNGTDFARGADINIDRNKPRKNTFNAHIFGRNYDIRYVSDVFDPSATIEDLNKFQGFVGRLWTPDGSVMYRIWMQLTPHDIVEAANKEQYNGLQDLFAKRWSFREQGEKFKATDLGALLSQYSSATSAQTKSEAKASIYLHAASGDAIEIRVKPGTHTIDSIVRDILPPLVSGMGSKAGSVLSGYSAHLLANHPITINDAKVERTKAVTLQPDGRYQFKLVHTAAPSPPAQPKPPVFQKPTTSTATAPSPSSQSRPQPPTYRSEPSRQFQPAGRSDSRQSKPQVDVANRREREASAQQHRRGSSGG